MHRKLRGEGLVAMSVAVDGAEYKPGALKFLQSKGATFANYWLDDPDETWKTKWDVAAVPVVFVFDRLGRRAGKFPDPDDPEKPYQEDMDKLVQKLLAEKLPGGEGAE